MFGARTSKVFKGKRNYTIDEYLALEKDTSEKFECWNEYVTKLNENDFFVESIADLTERINKSLANSS